MEARNLNPFTRAPGEWPLVLAGRAHAMERLKLAIGRVSSQRQSDVIYLHGPPGTGRTALLRAFLSAAAMRELEPVTVDETDGMMAFDEPGARAFVADDLDGWRFPERFIERARKTRQRGKTIAVVATGISVMREHDHIAYDENQVQLPLLTDEQATQVLVRTAATTDHTWEPNALERIVATSVGYPDILQNVAFLAWFNAQRVGTSEIADAHVLAAEASMPLANHFAKKRDAISAATRFRGAADTYMVLGRADEPLSIEELAERVNKRPLATDALGRLVNGLVDGGFVYRTGDGNAARYELADNRAGDAIRAVKPFGRWR